VIIIIASNSRSEFLGAGKTVLWVPERAKKEDTFIFPSDALNGPTHAERQDQVQVDTNSGRPTDKGATVTRTRPNPPQLLDKSMKPVLDFKTGAQSRKPKYSG
jgi:hypothetical protein